MKVAILGGYGLVGKELFNLLYKDSRISHITLVGQKQREAKVPCSKKSVDYKTLDQFNDLPSYSVIFSALDSEISKPWYIKNQEKINCFIDKGSAFRMDKTTPLAVPEMMSSAQLKSKRFASPNCTTLQFVLALNPIIDLIRDDLLILTTLQSVSGSGTQALEELREQKQTSSCYAHPIFNNILPECGSFIGQQTQEELKIQRESSKIFNRPLTLQTTCLRVPIERGHHISVTCFLKDWHHTQEDLYHQWSQCPRLKICHENKYPLSKDLLNSTDVFISRVRLNQRVLSFLISADNLMVGAAYNAWSIFDMSIKQKTIAHTAAPV